MKKKENKHLNFLLYSSENITAMLFGLVGMALIARVFGPENMGRLSVVQAVSAIFIFFATFGLDHFIVRDFTINKDDGELKGSLLVVQSMGWILYLTSILIYFYVQKNLAHDLLLILSVAVSTYFLRVLFLKLYLQAVNDAKSIAIAAIVSRVIAVIFLLTGSFYHFSFELMVMYLPIQAAVQAVMMLKGYKKAQLSNPEPLRSSSNRMKSMLKESFPVMLSGAIYFGYSQADILLISHFFEVKDVGIYSAAMRLVPQAAFLGHITVITFYSELNKHYQNDKEAFISYAIKIVRVQYLIAFTMALIFSLSSSLIIWLLYGDKFIESGVILSVGVWVWIFMFPAALFSRLLVLGKLAKYELIKTLVIAPISLTLNYFLIQQYGAIAAAYVAVITFMLADFLIYAVFKETRFIFMIGVNAIKTLIKAPIISIRESIALFRNVA